MAFGSAASVVALLAAGVAWTAGGPPSRQSEEPTAFLEKLVGEWSVVAEATLGPGREPIRLESREVARLLGGKWLVSESDGRAPDGRPVTAIRTLGYDPAEARFVGTWISSLQTHLWSYTGALDESGTVLTLETEGPLMGNPNTWARYREVFEVENGKHHVVRSMILGPDGEWFEFARAEYRRTD